MKKTICACALLLLFLFASALTFAAQSGSVADSRYIIDDKADLMSSDEEASLAASIEAILPGLPVASSVMIVTTDYTGGKDSTAYADDYFDDLHLNKGWPVDGALFLIDMDNRNMWISCGGAYIGILSYDRIDSTLDDCYNEIAQYDYKATALAFVNRLAGYAAVSSAGCLQLDVDDVPIDLYIIDNSAVRGWQTSDADAYARTRSDSYVVLYDSESNVYYDIGSKGDLREINGGVDKAFLPTTAQRYLYTYGGGGLIGLLVGLVSSMILRASAKHSGDAAKRAMGSFSYGEKVSIALTENTDRLIDKQTTRRYIPPPPPVSTGGGGGGTFGGGSTGGSMHTSSGGMSHSGGGRHF
ncbi:MAG: TPM domain-containing protein [Oscillospiraceae bacterium]|nr:TPM domain-containing protein [Oscillospiraceae bacterium]